MDDVKKRSFAAGYLMGLSGMPVAAAPAAYLASGESALRMYNGVPLPTLNWDNKTYPYAVIVYNRNLNRFEFSVYKFINYFESGGRISTTYFGTEEDGTALIFKCTPGESEWSQIDNTQWNFTVDRDKIERNAVYGRAIWANFDLMYSDNTLYVGASKPERITDPGILEDKYFHNDLVCRVCNDYDYLDTYYRHGIIKTEEAYIGFRFLRGFGDGSQFKIDYSSNKVYARKSEISWHSAARLDFGTDNWYSVSIAQYLGEEVEIDGSVYWYICDAKDLIWAHEDISYFAVLSPFKGTEPIPVPIPEKPPEIEIYTDNKALVLGCRLGYIVREQLASGDADVPMNVLASSDGYILKDSNGLYLCAMKGEL